MWSLERVALFCKARIAVNITCYTYQYASSSAVAGGHYLCKVAALKHGILFLDP